MVNSTDHAFQSSDGYAWHYRRFTPNQVAARAELVVLHGIQSHGGWYTESATKLAEAGYAVSLLDRRGCGRNSRDRGDAPSFRRLLDDVIEFAMTLPPSRVVVGISWGGKLAAALPWRSPGLFAGAALVAPGLCPRVRPSFGEQLRVMSYRLLAPARLLPIPLNEPELFTANPIRQKFIRDDALMLRHATARMMFESGRLDVRLSWAVKAVRGPVFVALAKHDRIIDNDETRAYVSRFGSADVTVREYDGHHTLEFEPGGPPFVDDLREWLGTGS